MAKRPLRADRFTVGTEASRLVVEVVGGHPDSLPYLWIGEGTRYLDSVAPDDLLLLREAIDRAIGRAGEEPNGD